MEAIRAMVPFLVPVILLELVLVFVALRDLTRRDRVNGPKWLWALIIVLIQLFGPILYFVIGRRDE